jgi:DNA-binding transcriptional regulator YdaS (Cro superfamily)
MQIRDLVARVGGTTKLGKACGVSKQAPYSWRLVPPRHVPAISKAFNIPRHELRPDLWEKPEE